MKKSTLYIIATAMVALLVVIGVYVTRTHQLKQRTALVSLYGEIRRTLGDFHADVMALTPSAGEAAGLENEMHRLKGAATRRLEQMKEVQGKVTKLPSTPVNDCLVEATEKSAKYLEGCASWANLETDGATMRARSGVMNDTLEAFRAKAGLTGSTDKGDTAGEISRIGSIASKLETAHQQAEVAATAAAAAAASAAAKKASEANDADSEEEYWRNNEFTGYRRQTRSIVQRYADGRRILGAVLEHFDSGVYSDGDRANLVNQYSLRQGLLQEIDRLSGTLPPGSVYGIHHAELRQMLTDACDAMGQFANCPNGTTRSNLSAVSSRNGALLNRLKRFYGVS